MQTDERNIGHITERHANESTKMKLATESQKAARQATREELTGLDAADYQELREDYYKAAEGLYGMEEVLKRLAKPGTALSKEHQAAKEALEAFRKLTLGATL